MLLAMNRSAYILIILALLLQACEEPAEEMAATPQAQPDPMAEDSFFMRNPEIREDLLKQLTLNDIEHWINGDNSIGFYVKDTEEVDRLANEAIGVYISLQ